MELFCTLTLTADDIAEVRIVDLYGRTVHASSNRQAKGTITEQVSTSEWAPGTYFVRVKAGGHSATIRVMVADR